MGISRPVTEFSKRLAIGITQNQFPDMVIIDNPGYASYTIMDKLEDITEAVKEIADLDQYFSKCHGIRGI